MWQEHLDCVKKLSQPFLIAGIRKKIYQLFKQA